MNSLQKKVENTVNSQPTDAVKKFNETKKAKKDSGGGKGGNKGGGGGREAIMATVAAGANGDAVAEEIIKLKNEGGGLLNFKDDGQLFLKLTY